MAKTTSADAPSVSGLPPEALAERLADDAAAVSVYRDGLASIINYIDTTPETFSPLDPEELPSRSRKEDLWTTWKSFLDYSFALESIRQFYGGYWRMEDPAARREAFRLLYASFLAQYRFALEFLERTGRHPKADVILNDPVPELGLSGGTYAAVKFRFLNVLRAGEFASLKVIDKSMAGPEGALDAGIAEDSEVIWRMGRGKGEALTLKNALRVVRDAAFTAWFPVQKGVSQLMGHVKVRRQGLFLVTEDQVRSLLPELRPGDVAVTRREWFFSNVGLPGFWSHAALYIGTEQERRRHLAGEDVKAWVRRQGEAGGDFEVLLKSRYPEAYALFTAPDEAGRERRVIEAVGEGVIFTAAERALGADSVAVLRPRLSGPERASAILKAFHYSGRPYDFNFDFTTDSSLVCSELVYKSYEPTAQAKGLRLPLTKVVGRPVVAPNDIVRLFDEETASGNGQFELVAFLDGFEKAGRAVRGELDEFRRSWQRPNWHILVQEGGEEP